MNRDLTPAETHTIADLRLTYTKGGLTEDDAGPDPIALFRRWFNDAINARLHEPNAMTLATHDPADPLPDARIVLLKELEDHPHPGGFVFYTNYTSRKARQIQAHPHAALVFHWGPLERQVRIRGHLQQVSPEQTARYFHSRPRPSQIGAWASHQSAPIPDRQTLETRETELLARFPDNQPIPVPPFWGGYRLTPQHIEFWQGRPSRLHDRLHYTLPPEGNWQRERLAP